MLIPDNVRPENSIYFNGAIILKILIEKRKRMLIELYCDVMLSHKMSYNVFILSLDWLFLIGAITYKMRRYQYVHKIITDMYR